MTAMNNYSFANNFYDSSLDNIISSNNDMEAIKFNGLDNLNAFITKSSSYINNLYEFFHELSIIEKANLKKTAAVIHKYEKTFTNKDTIPKNWYENVHDPLLQILKNRNINHQKYANSLENDVLYHLKTIQSNINNNLNSSMLKLQRFKQNLVQLHTLIKTKESKMEHSKVKLRQIDMNLQMANGPGYGEKQLQKLVKEQQSQIDVINNIQNDIYVHRTDFECLLKNYKEKWVEITESIQEEQFNRYQYCLELINNSFEKGYDDLMSQSLHDLEQLKFKLINYDFEKDLKWLSYKFGTGYKDMSPPKNVKRQHHTQPSVKGSMMFDDTYDNANDNIDKHITMGFNNQTTFDESHVDTKFCSNESLPYTKSFKQQDNLYESNTPQEHTFQDHSQYARNNAILSNISQFELPSGLEEVHLGSMRYSSSSSHAVFNDDNESESDIFNKNSFKTTTNGTFHKHQRETLSHKEQMKLMMKSVESIEGVNWRNRKQKINQQKHEAPEVPEREENLFWSEEEDNDSNEQSSADITFKKTAHETEMPHEPTTVSNDESNAFHNEKEEEAEEGDLTMLTNAVKKMKERKFKRKSVLNDLDSIPLNEPSESEIKSLKVFVPSHR
jgi:hypothetical protein